MRTIIAGSRLAVVQAHIDTAMRRCGWTPTTVISGTAGGADRCGENWAQAKGIPVERYPADWATHGKRAGMLRNTAMAEAADALVAVWDGQSKGTRQMIRVARDRGLRVYVHHIWTCRHCESWGKLICILGRDIYPIGTPETCDHFCREPGSDDEFGEEAQKTRAWGVKHASRYHPTGYPVDSGAARRQRDVSGNFNPTQR